jgi:hypothetical protein
MTVRELITKLEKFPPLAIVMRGDSEYGGFFIESALIASKEDRAWATSNEEDSLSRLSMLPPDDMKIVIIE